MNIIRLLFLIMNIEIFFNFEYELTRTEDFWQGLGKAIYSHEQIRFFSDKIKGGAGAFFST